MATKFVPQEIADLIAIHLDRSDLVRCINVCKSWESVFAPHLYSHVTHGDGYSVNSVISWTGVQRYGRCIRSLYIATCVFPEAWLFGSECRFLTSLELGTFDDMCQPEEWSIGLRELLYYNPSIHTFRIKLHEDLAQPLFQQHQILRYMPQLKHLTVLGDRYPCSYTQESNGVFDAILEYGTQLESLVYHVTSSGISSHQSQGGSSSYYGQDGIWLWSNLTSLEILDTEGHRGMELMRRCPNVRRIHLDCQQNEHNYEMLRQLVRSCHSGNLTELDQLEIVGMTSPKAVAALQNLILNAEEAFRPRSLSLIRSKVSAGLLGGPETLEKLIIQQAYPKTKYNPIFPCSHARLKQLEVAFDEEYMKEIQDEFNDFVVLSTPEGSQDRAELEKMTWVEVWLNNSEPWACTELDTFRITFRPKAPKDKSSKRQPSSPTSPRRPSVLSAAAAALSAAAAAISSVANRRPEVKFEARWFWKRMGQLTQLKTLSVNVLQTSPSCFKFMSLTEEDVVSLSGLKHLQELQIPSSKKFMSDSVKEALLLAHPDLKITSFD
ncbi:hypothetical protein B0O80DRAFT_464411 [Mortierella sp. GBAus27b]|nr:hypothetical protein BGX31_007634 [Mortierella sp. GBA43]KAI8347821.1 hypothetical protein B0O80DRAFT_464411 [Mortierella sp. GBAus27b]